MKIALNKTKDGKYEIFDTLNHQVENGIATKEIDDKYDLDCSQNGSFVAFNKRFDGDTIYLDLIDWTFRVKEGIKIEKLAQVYEKNGTNIIIASKGDNEELKEKMGIEHGSIERQDKGKEGKIVLVDEDNINNDKQISKKEKEKTKLKDLYTKDTRDRKKIAEENEKQATRDYNIQAVRNGVYINRKEIPKLEREKIEKVALQYQISLAKYKNVFPFEGSALSLLVRHWTDNPFICPTLGVSPGNIFINTEFFMSTMPSERIFILAHEAGHLMLRHNARLLSRNPELWNIAGDLIINSVLVKEFGMKYSNGDFSTGKCGEVDVDFPIGGLYSEDIDLSKDNTESVYQELVNSIPQEKKEEIKIKISCGGGGGDNGSDSRDGDSNGKGKDNQKNNKGNGNSNEKQGQNEEIEITFRGKKIKFNPKMLGDTMCNEEDKKSNKELEESNIENAMDAINQAAKTIANMGGNQAGDGNMSMLREMWERDHVDAPNWALLLKRFLRNSVIKVKTRQRLNKGVASGRLQGVLLMGDKRLKADLKKVLIAIDTSGSLSDDDLKIIGNTIETLFKSAQGSGISQKKVEGYICFWNTNVIKCEPFKNKNDVKKEACGGGGTDVNCVFAKAQELKSDLIIIFTDGEFSKPKEEYKTEFDKTIWALDRKDATKFICKLQEWELPFRNNIGIYGRHVS